MRHARDSRICHRRQLRIGKAIEILHATGVENDQFRDLGTLHERLRSYLGVCFVASVVLVTVKGMSADEAKAERAKAKRKLFPAKKPPIQIGDWLAKKLED